MNSIGRWVFVGGGTLVALLLLLFGVALLYEQWEYSQWKPQLQQLQLDAPRYLSAFCEDSAALDAEPFFQQAPGKRDAADFLNARLEWDGATDAGVFTPKEPLIPPEASLRTMTTPDFLEVVTEAECVATDRSWLGSLRDFDRWTIVGHGGPLSDAPHTAGWRTGRLPMPNIDALLLVTRLHLACGLAHGDARNAARDVRQLAWLLLTTELPLAPMATATLLGYERHTWDRAHERGVDVAGWEPIPKRLTDALRRVTRVAPVLLGPAVATPTADSALLCLRPQLVRCAALTDASGVYMPVTKLPDEPWRSRARRRLAQLNVADTTCTFEYARYRQKRPFIVVATPHGLEQKTGMFLLHEAQADELEKTYPSARIPTDAGTPADAGRP